MSRKKPKSVPATNGDNDWKKNLQLPEALGRKWPPLPVESPTGCWGVISDIHIPYHDKVSIELFAKEAVRRRVVGILINGDLFDSTRVSRHDQEPDAPRYRDEIEMTVQFLIWLRQRFPKVRMIYKLGNHEVRLERYIADKAGELFGLEGLNLPSLLHMKEYDIEYVEDLRIIQLGKLNVIHGHEYRGSGGVNPARWLYLKARSVALCGHFHRTSEHHSRDIRGHPEAAWSTGCMCTLTPDWLPINEWNLGFAFVHLSQNGDFEVDNRRVLNGRIV